jgi:hypothetical protein
MTLGPPHAAPRVRRPSAAPCFRTARPPSLHRHGFHTKDGLTDKSRSPHRAGRRLHPHSPAVRMVCAAAPVGSGSRTDRTAYCPHGCVAAPAQLCCCAVGRRAAVSPRIRVTAGGRWWPCAASAEEGEREGREAGPAPNRPDTCSLTPLPQLQVTYIVCGVANTRPQRSVSFADILIKDQQYIACSVARLECM